ncbi:putative choline kinase [Spiroplasma corruscae]|uniref:Putative choline kinase n=1 Tax=Spiroplasma corruscae TaxID=216934 RepID=A0A222EPB9_9MOLU|nr:phosphotransferase [Spiroplasma corruscae]ASP28113.1 putative choline kinase [Spiroplasma corruscae]
MKKNIYNGLTNKLINKRNLLVKIYMLKKVDYLDKKNEYEVLNIFKNLNQDILLKPISFKLTKKKLISKFEILENYKDLSKINIEEFHIRKVVDLIYSFHKLKSNLFNSIKVFDYKKMLDYFYKNIKKPFFNLDKYYKEICNKLENLKGLKKVISHNDLVPGNIMFKDDNFLLIDYDYIMMNDKYFDYASFITETLNENNENIGIFINQLIKKRMLIIDKNEFNNLNTVIKYQDLLWTLWANYMFENKKDDIYKKIYMEKYDRLKFRKQITF